MTIPALQRECRSLVWDHAVGTRQPATQLKPQTLCSTVTAFLRQEVSSCRIQAASLDSPYTKQIAVPQEELHKRPLPAPLTWG